MPANYYFNWILYKENISFIEPIHDKLLKNKIILLVMGLENNLISEGLQDRIIKYQRKLDRINPQHPLLDMVSNEMLWMNLNQEFCERYQGMSKEAALTQYVDDLKSAIKQ